MSGQLLLVLVYLVLIVLPGWLLAASFRGRLFSLATLSGGAAGATAATLVCTYGLAAAGLLHSAWWLPPVLLFAAGLTACLRRRPGREVPSFSRWEAGMWLLLGACELYVISLSPWPQGWDPAFHSLLAEKIRLSGHLSTDWSPFEPIPLNYPQGLHAFAAWLALLTGKNVPLVLQSLHWPFQMGAALALFVLSLQLYGDRRAACLGVCVYGFWGYYGTFLSYTGWGGLPTELGFWLFLVVGSLSQRQGSPVLAGVLLGCIGLVHHLSAMIVAAAILASFAADACARRFWLRASAVALVLFSPYWVPYLAKAGQLQGGSSALRFDEEAAIWNPFAYLGVVPVLGGLAGLGYARPRLIVTWLLAWSCTFVALDWVYRVAAVLLTGHNFAAFTPSRWLTALAYPLALSAGVALARLPRRWLQPLVALGLIWGVARHGYLPQPTRFSAATLAWLQPMRRLPPNTLIAFAQPPQHHQWLAYLTWHPTLTTPIPASEDRRPKLRRQAMFSRYHEWAQRIDEELAREGLTYVIVEGKGP